MTPEPYRAEPGVVLGLDLGTRLGWAVVVDGPTPRARRVASGVEHFKTKPSEPAGRRYFLARQFLRRLIAEHRPAFIGTELVRRHEGIAAAHVYGAMRGIMLELAYALAITVIDLEVAAIKTRATGKGNAAKPAIIAAARAAWPTATITDDNEADALWIADLANDRVSIPF